MWPGLTLPSRQLLPSESVTQRGVQILLLRELGVDLAPIFGVVDAEHDRIEALRRHHRRLLDEHERLRGLAGTVATTLEHLEEGTGMPAENLFGSMTRERGEYLGATLSSDHTAKIALPSAELRSWAWCTDDDLQDRLPAHMLRRTRAALRARADGATLYLEKESPA
jgi:hypothetical protein